MTRRPILATLLAVLTLGLGACAGSTDDGDKASQDPAGMMPSEPGEVDLTGALETPFCQAFVRIVETLSTSGNATDAAAQAEVLRQLKVDYAAATEAAPPEVKVDAEITNQAVQEFATLADLFGQSPAVTAAGERVNDYVAKTCGFDPGDLDPNDPRG